MPWWDSWPLAWGSSGSSRRAQPPPPACSRPPPADPYATLAAAISTGLACVGAGIAVAGSGAAAVGAIAEKPEVVWPFPHLCGPVRGHCHLRAADLLPGAAPLGIAMQIRVIGHPDAILGFALAGVTGSPVRTEAEARKALDEVLKLPEAGIVLVTKDVGAHAAGPNGVAEASQQPAADR